MIKDELNYHKPKAMSKYELVQLYYEGIDINPVRVYRFFRDEIHANKSLMLELEKYGYKKSKKHLTVNEVSLIFKHLTPPIVVEK
jgi:hypothetical protein